MFSPSLVLISANAAKTWRSVWCTLDYKMRDSGRQGRGVGRKKMGWEGGQQSVRINGRVLRRLSQWTSRFHSRLLDPPPFPFFIFFFFLSASVSPTQPNPPTTHSPVGSAVVTRAVSQSVRDLLVRQYRWEIIFVWKTRLIKVSNDFLELALSCILTHATRRGTVTPNIYTTVTRTHWVDNKGNIQNTMESQWTWHEELGSGQTWRKVNP